MSDTVLSPAHAIFKDKRCPIGGVELGLIGDAFGVQFSAHANPAGNFSVRMADGPESADELIQHQIMKGGYDGKMRMLVEYRRVYVPLLDDPFIAVTFFQKETAIEKLTHNPVENVKAGTLVEWRENAWREEARKLLRTIEAYNPVTGTVCHVTRSFTATELSPEEAGIPLRHEGQKMFREDEVLTVVPTPVHTLPKTRYLEHFFKLLEEVRGAMGCG